MSLPAKGVLAPFLGPRNPGDPSHATGDSVRVRLTLNARIPASTPARVALIGLVAILVLGTVLRLLFMLAWSPAFMGFLRDLHALGGQLWPTIAIQHISGLASAAFWWLIVRRCGGRPWLALFPAAVVALDGGQMFLEHSTLSESLFILLLSAGIYVAVRSLDADGARWPALSGLMLAIACTVRVVALPLLVVLLVWLALMAGGDWRRRLRQAAIAGVGALTILGGYAVAQHQQTGYWGLTTPAGPWNLYSRVAPFADCHRFKPPSGTATLCEHTSPARRTATVADYAYSPASPAVRAFSWGTERSFHENRSLMSFLFAYESAARITGPMMAAMMVLSFFALFAPAGRPRQAARLLFLVAWVTLIVPPATHEWDARYTIPALGPLAAVATLGAWQLGRLLRREGRSFAATRGSSIYWLSSEHLIFLRRG